MECPSGGPDGLSRSFEAPGPDGHPSPGSRATARSRRGAAQGWEPEATPATSPTAARPDGPGGAPIPAQNVSPAASQGPSGASGTGRRPFGSHLGTSSHREPSQGRRVRINPYTAESREERKAVRARIALAEELAGHDTAAGNLRGCEFTIWGMTPGGRVAISVKDGKASREVAHCDHRLCPCCAPRRAKRLKDKLRPAIEATFKCRAPRLITLTQDDRAGESLASAFKRLMAAFTKLRRLKRWTANVRGGLVSLEVTRNGSEGHWHAHLHLLVDTDWYEQEDLLADWRAALGTTGMPIGGARIEEAGRRKEHVAGCKRQGCACPTVPVEDQLGAGVDEVVKYVGKGIEIAREWSDEDLQELVEWMRGKRLLRTFGSLYNVHIDEDETPTTEVEGDGEDFYDPLTGELMTLADLQWRADAEAQQQGWRLLAAQWAQRRRGEASS